MRINMANLKSSFTPSSGNVFADLGFDNAEELDTKARLGIEIAAIIKRKRLKQAQISKKLDISQPKVSALVNHRFDGFSVDKLIGFLTRLECDIRIDITPVNSRTKKGSVKVVRNIIAISGSAPDSEIFYEEARQTVVAYTQFDRAYMPHSLAEYACAFGLDKAALPHLLPRMT